jgi:predicted TIM-barrel fold metal-dependent hydrolase
MAKLGASGMDEFSRIISVDDHVVEPPRVWQDRLPRKYLSVGPRVVRQGIANARHEQGKLVVDEDPHGKPVDWWLYEDLRRPIDFTLAVAGLPRERWGDGGISFDEMRPGCYDPVERLKDMDLNGIEASLCFPNVLPRFCGQTFLEARDKELALLCVKAYNDWMAEEWVGPSNGRLIQCSIVPLWDPQLAAFEIRRNAARGARAVTFPELPASLGLPSIHSGHWNPVFDACNETATAVCMHVGSSSKYPTTSHDAPYIVAGMLLHTNVMASMSDWLFSGCFEEYADLKVVYSEGNIGWIPFIVERADRYWEMQTHAYDRSRVKRRPSEYYAEHIFSSYVSDTFGLRSISTVGLDNVAFETDYPHADGSWPNSVDVARRELAHLALPDRLKVLRSNAIRMLSLDLDQRAYN